MSESKKPPHPIESKDIVSAVAATALSVGAELAKSSNADIGQLALVGGISVLPTILGWGTSLHAQRKVKEAHRLWDTITSEWAKHEEMQPEEIAARLEERLRSERKEARYMHETIWRSIRGLMEAVDDAATVPLAVLAQEYLRNEQGPDAFFRGVVSLLQELNRREMLEVCAMLKWALNSDVSNTACIVADHRDGRWMLRLEQIMPKDESGTWTTRKGPYVDSMISEPDRILFLLEQNRLTVQTHIERGLPSIVDTVLVRTTAERLCSYLDLIED
ncbi:hypothetical protein [Polyangium jinanense]|uniref:Uncharacterized protein n=1 Tax=Polyangium jinanense TaxID=2829994 RepID=A0A9X3XAS5_9BACT|nr:hypothetical protein [Polyangium jinanense]MDC3987297.1 hypothetical protein [Polyangium jinanense]